MAWFGLAVTPTSGGSAVLNTTVPGLFIVSVAGLALVRARLAAPVTGGITVLGIGTSAGN